MAAARSRVGPNCGSHARDATWGSRTFSNHDNLSSAVVFGRDLAPDSDNAPGH